jgi:DNA replication protein DnaC
LQAIKQGFVVLYRSIFDVVRDFLHEEALGEDDKLLARYLKPDLVIIDDMGMKQLPRRSGEVLFEIIMRRYETRSAVMTSNRPLQDCGKRAPTEGWSGDVPSATAILDRFLHHADVIQITGKSYRLRHQATGAKEPTAESKPANAPISLPGSTDSTNDSVPEQTTARSPKKTATAAAKPTATPA